MQVKIGDKIYDSEKEPVMVMLSLKDYDNIRNMRPYCKKYCAYPSTEEYTKDNYKKVREFMKTE